MTIWILRFVPYAGGQSIDGFFRTKEEAMAAKDAAVTAGEFVDDFGVEVFLDPSQCAAILTNTKSAADFTAALQAANSTAGRAYSPTILKGSTVQ